MSKTINFNVQKEVNENFKDVWTSKKPYNILSGGRNSFKSSVIALKITSMWLDCIAKGYTVNVVVTRKVGKTIRDSVYNKMKWALSKFDMLDRVQCTVAPFKITHIKSGSSIYFYGADDFEKLKSNDIGNLIAVWHEEAAEYKSAEEFDQTNITFMRQKHHSVDHVKVFWSFNPPRNMYHWINEWTKELEKSKSHLIHKSTYLEDKLGFVTEQMLEETERIKENDYEYYKYIFLGIATGLGTNIYNIKTFNKVNNIPATESKMALFVASDTGHQNSATVHQAWVLCQSGNVYLYDQYFYKPKNEAIKKAPSELSKEYKEWSDRIESELGMKIYKRTIDSAEGALRNQFFRDFRITTNPIAKKKKHVMIEHTRTLLALGRVFILDKECNKIFLEEVKNYRWDDKTIKSDDPKVIKEDDDTCDAFQYFVNDNLVVLNIKGGN